MMLNFSMLFNTLALALFMRRESLALSTGSGDVTAPISKHQRSAVIIGAGPVGLAASLMLVKCGWNDITIVEKRSKEFIGNTFSYIYTIDGRSQKVTDLLGLSPKIVERGLNTRSNPGFTSVNQSGFIINTVLPAGITSDFLGQKYTMTRSVLVKIFSEEVSKSDKIKILYSSKCDDIDVNDGVMSLNISSILNDKDVATFENTRVTKIKSDLLLGCDGINSNVRTWLMKNENEKKHGWFAKKNRFSLVKLKSASAGLQFKMLAVKSRFPLKKMQQSTDNDISANGKDEPIFAEENRRYMFPGNDTGFVVFSITDNAIRAAVFVSGPKAPIWNIKSGKEMREFLEKNIPQVDYDQLTTDSDIEKFALSSAGVFPDPQYVRGLQETFQSKETALDGMKRACGVALAGDSLHAFPPDCGQGLNAGLEDIFVLYQALRDNDNDVKKALSQYEEVRMPCAAAVTRISQIGRPYQYGQAPRKAKLWAFNFFLRIMLNKKMPALFSPPVINMIVKSSDSTYTEILQRANRTTRNIFLCFSLLFFGFFAAFVKFPFKAIFKF